MFSQPLRGWAASGALAGALAIAGCGSSGSDPATTATPAAATATPASTAKPVAATPLPNARRGRGKRPMTGRDWRPAGKGYPLGTFGLNAKPNGDVDMYFPGKAAVDFSTEFATTQRQLT